MKISLLPLLLPFFGHLLLAQNTCAISGTVVDAISGHAVAQVKVFAGSPAITGQDNTAPTVRRITNPDGRFCFERLSAGSYKITAQKTGYLDITYGEQHANSPALPIAVNPDRPAGPPLMLKIMPQATISGIVTDADGDPISNMQIRLWKRSLLKDGPSNLEGAQADEQGRFRLWSIAPGTYYISAMPPALVPGNMNRANSLDSSGQPLREREVETFYKGALTLKNATPIVIKAGQEITGIAIPIQRAASRHISGRVSWDVQSSGPFHIWLAIPNQGMSDIVKVENDGRFHAEGLTAGRYSLIAMAPNPNLSARKEVDLTDGDADGILLEPHERFDIKASVHLDGSKAVLPLEDSELVSENEEGASSAQEDDDGTWRFSRLIPGIYHFVYWSNPEHYFVKRVLVDGESHPGNVIDLLAHKPQTLEIVLGLSTAAITGQMTNGNEPVPSATIALIDEDHQDDVRLQGAPASGQFEIKSLAPGKYRIYAFEDFDREAWASKDFRTLLVPKSAFIELRDGEKRQVAIPLISAKESQAAVRKIAN